MMQHDRPRLSYAVLDRLPSSVSRPDWRVPPPVGIVHFGPGAFHRAHQAAYVDTLLATDPTWGIAAVSLRSKGTVTDLAAQQGLYTLAVRDAESAHRIIGAHSAFLGPDDSAQIRALLAAPTTRLVTTTVTEKGYCLAPDGSLDFNHPDIAHDLAGAEVPRSVIGWIVAGLEARHAAGEVAFVVMPCDNLANNGAKLHAALIAYAGAHDPYLAEWIAGEVRVPGTMVDSITPATDEALYGDVADVLGVVDRATVQREAFTQWVIEDLGTAAGTALASAGATLTDNVAGYEQAKLRVLNGSHSTLAYAGLLRGATSVAEAMQDAPLAAFVDAMIRDEILPTLPSVAGFDHDAYRRQILARFRNPAIVHRLDQIAGDGSQKLPYRLGDTLAWHRARGELPRRVIVALGCWVAFLMRRSRGGVTILDPAGAALATAAADGDAAAVLARLVADGLGFDSALAEDGATMAAIATAADAAFAGAWDKLLG
ncbi:mannitol dehydrogenase family protein [Sphingomonas echinoides]|uniref:mannitol dehydrogenase family protein n=1 Tax=Sphingomonas echinoides TaxID=59803 RepID=UPI002413B37A|nr:mannitol dehydrogenase family protein [Sphingomonas echinoides]